MPGCIKTSPLQNGPDFSSASTFSISSITCVSGLRTRIPPPPHSGAYHCRNRTRRGVSNLAQNYIFEHIAAAASSRRNLLLKAEYSGHGHSGAGPALRISDTAEVAVVRRGGCAVAGTRDRRECRYLHAD